jgi:hypothetical protein
MKARTFAAVAGLLMVVLTAATGRAEECIFGQAAPPGPRRVRVRAARCRVRNKY